MTPRSLLGTTLLLVAACAGGTEYTTLTATPSAGPADAISCARDALTKLGYRQAAYDEEGHRVVARKVDNDVTRADPQFRRLVNSIEVTAAPNPQGKTNFKVVGHSIGEFMTHRGPTEVEEKASPAVKQAAQSLVQTCGQA
jgi:hypothetical protein